MPLNAVVTPVTVVAPRAVPWLRRITDHVVRHGLADASLRRLASVAGTSHVQLGYYFGSRDQLLGAVLRELRRRESVLLFTAASSRREALEKGWAWFTSTEHALEMSLFFCIASAAAADPGAHATFLEAVTSEWTDGLQSRGLAEGRSLTQARNEALMLLGATRGLLLERLLAQDEQSREAIDAAFSTLLDCALIP